jgi:hypothetical protein
MNVAIIGCGPAGMFAAEACSQQGVPFSIYAPKGVSSISGAQYLHEAIPWLTGDQDGYITFKKIGTRDGYALKVYGHLGMDVSWDTFTDGPKPYWSLQSAYLTAWMRYEEHIKSIKVKPTDIRKLKKDYSLVINTAPKIFLCKHPDDHKFTSQTVFLTLPEERHLQNGNQIIYNGQREVPWYRWSFIHGLSCYEFSHDPKYKKKETIEIRKPLINFCDCHEGDGYLEVGRYGRWRKGALTHEAYFKTMDKIDALQ